jgi:hypothetical protein
MSYGHFPAKNGSKSRIATLRYLITVFPHIRPTGIIILYSFQMRVLLENTTFLLHKIVRIVELLELRVLFKGGPYMRKYDNSRTATSYLSSPLLA